MNFTTFNRPFQILSLIIGFYLLPAKSFCQKVTENPGKSSIELTRISEYGKVWGAINYFHPEMGKGRLNGDSLFLNNIADLPSNASAINFKKSISGMLAELGDPTTEVFETLTAQQEAPAGARKNNFQYNLPGGQIYLALPQTTFIRQINIDSILDKGSGKSFIIDLRNDGFNNLLGLKQYTLLVQPLVAGIIKNTMLLPTERGFFYKGLMRQDFQHDINFLNPNSEGNVEHLQVNNGFRNIAEGGYLLANTSKNYSQNSYCFIINKFTNINSVKALMALRNRNLCRLVFDGVLPEYLYGTFYYMKLPDNLTAKIRISEVIYEDGTLGCKPDVVTQYPADTTLTSLSIKSAVNLLKAPIINQSNKRVENTVFIRTPANSYSTTGTPGVDLRLLGLFNFWNTIHFFSPNKKLIAVDWDATLPYFINNFLAANSDEKYFMALMELTSAIRDGHGILINTKTGRSPKGFLDGNLPFACDLIDNKVYVTSIMPDTTQKNALSQLEYGDEVIAIDQIPVNALIKKWSSLLVASNQAGFNRELYATWFTAGSIGSIANVTVIRDGHQKNITLKRIKRDDYYSLWGKVVRTPATPPSFPPYCKILKGNVGCLRLNRIYTNELDSLANLLKGCKKIIIDARGYPRDGSIGTNIAAYIASKTDTVSYDEFPFITSPDTKKNQTLTEYSIIEPNTNPSLKHQQYYILADEGVQSQGEWNVIVLQGVTKAITIGRTTAGANGIAVTVPLPGNYQTFFSGFGEYYMDHTANQKNGVKIDIQVKKTLKAAIAGEDDILAKALSVIESN